MAQSVGEKTGINSTLGITPKSEDFVKQAATSDIFEIQSSQIVQPRYVEEKIVDGSPFATIDDGALRNSSGAVGTSLPSSFACSA